MTLPRVAAAAAFLLVALAIHAPALDGAFLSDDRSYLTDNPYVQQPLRHLGEILTPGSGATRIVRNYAPVHVGLHAIGWQLFGADPRGHHVLNVIVHGLASLALVALFLRAGVPEIAAWLGGLIFLVHPANVEAVAWISQLKTSSCVLLATLALLLRPGWPVASAIPFALALLAKPLAAAALPFALVADWIGARDAAPLRAARRVPATVAWAAAFAGFALLEWSAFAQDGPAAPVDPDPWVRLATSLSIAGRYLWMAATSLGTSTFHEPAPVRGLGDPLLLAALAALALVSWRALWALRAGRIEAAFWAWALAAYLPVSQIVPFRFAMADRYLYTVLPGLLGAALLSLAPWLSRTPRRGVRVVATVCALALACAFGVRAHERARVWKTPWRVAADAALHYPDGTLAALMLARSRAAAADVDGTVAALERMRARGWNELDGLLHDPAFERVREAPAFRAAVAGIAADWIAFYREQGDLVRMEWLHLARLHRIRGEDDRARRALERGLDADGAGEELVRAELEALRAEVDVPRAGRDAPRAGRDALRAAPRMAH